LKVKYSPEFKAMYDALPTSIQRQFQAVDAMIMRGEMDSVRSMGWARYVNINDHYCGMGSNPESGVFYWIWIGEAGVRPMIF